MRVFVLFLFAFGILLADPSKHISVQEDIDSSYKDFLEKGSAMKKFEIVGLKPEDQRKLFDRSSKTYIEFPILSGSKPTITIQAPPNWEVSSRWRLLSCSDLGKLQVGKYARAKKIKTVVRLVFQDGKSQIVMEDKEESDSKGYDAIPVYVENYSAFNNTLPDGRKFFKHFLIEIYIEDAFRKETGNLCVSEILPFDS
ncbi:hypothetical protein [Leptospira weilii]|uniref:hypothetical protein n=1 Tax=Leptospira weilii TaxID=28184 RepID=UPI000774A170|nr:hypothetical protein [Leptospira weilii]